MGQTDESQFSVEERAVMGMILCSLDLDLFMQLLLMIYKLVSLMPSIYLLFDCQACRKICPLIYFYMC
jgi:hypothetical protein